jgi:hypothetical protein
VYTGKDPLTGRELRFRKTRRTEVEAQTELGKLLELARAGQPDSDVTVADLGYIRRTIPALGAKEVRRVRGPLLDNHYPRLKKCGNLAWVGKPFTEHRQVPDLRPDPSDRPGAGHGAPRVPAPGRSMINVGQARIRGSKAVTR